MLSRSALRLFIGFVAFAVLCTAAPAAESASGRLPNIVCIVADDLGYGDVSCHGGDIPTPNIDLIAREGARFTNWYVSSPYCTPSRYSLLTGRQPQRSRGLRVPLNYAKPQDKDKGLRASETTLSTLLKRSGYRTAMVGKWHLGHGCPSFHPTAHGFDSFYGLHSGCIDYFMHRYGYLNLRDWWRNDTLIDESGYVTDLLTDEAVRVIELQDAKQPFFLYLSHLAVHVSKKMDDRRKEMYYMNQAKPEDLIQFEHIVNWDRHVYSAMVKSLDDGVGQVLNALKKRGLEENTLVIFISDNGGNTRWGADNRPLRGGKGELFEGGIRVPCVMKWPGRIEPNTILNQPCSTLDLRPTICKQLGFETDGLVTDGIDISSVIFDGKNFQRDLFWAFPQRGDLAGEKAFRRGPWKFMQPRNGKQPGEPMLFNLDEDPGETHNLISQYPEKLKELLLAHKITEQIF